MAGTSTAKPSIDHLSVKLHFVTLQAEVFFFILSLVFASLFTADFKRCCFPSRLRENTREANDVAQKATSASMVQFVRSYRYSEHYTKELHYVQINTEQLFLPPIEERLFLRYSITR